MDSAGYPTDRSESKESVSMLIPSKSIEQDEGRTRAQPDRPLMAAQILAGLLAGRGADATPHDYIREAVQTTDYLLKELARR